MENRAVDIQEAPLNRTRPAPPRSEVAGAASSCRVDDDSELAHYRVEGPIREIRKIAILQTAEHVGRSSGWESSLDPAEDFHRGCRRTKPWTKQGFGR